MRYLVDTKKDSLFIGNLNLTGHPAFLFAKSGSSGWSTKECYLVLFWHERGQRHR